MNDPRYKWEDSQAVALPFIDQVQQLDDMGPLYLAFARESLQFLKVYNQPFVAEDIPKLFVGWKEHVYFQTRFNLREGVYVEGFEKVTYYSGVCEFEVVTPKTLGDFISDCHRAGIKLFWKGLPV